MQKTVCLQFGSEEAPCRAKKPRRKAGICTVKGAFVLATVDKNDTVSLKNETIAAEVKPSVGVLGAHKGYQIVPLLLADFHHIFHPIKKTLIKINNERLCGIILCGSIGIVLCDLFCG